MRTPHKTTTLTLCAALALSLGAASALALDDARHKKMLKSSPAYAKADAELGRAWKALQAAHKRAGVPIDGGKRPPHIHSMLANQRDWLERRRDERARELRGGGSEADGYAAAARERARELRGMTEELNGFAALPAPAPAGEFSRLLAAKKGDSLFFVECAGEEGEAAQRCAKTVESGPIFVEFEANGDVSYGVSGGPSNPPGRWKVEADGTIRDTNSCTYTLIDGKYLKRDEGDDVTWFRLDEDE